MQQMRLQIKTNPLAPSLSPGATVHLEVPVQLRLGGERGGAAVVGTLVWLLARVRADVHRQC